MSVQVQQHMRFQIKYKRVLLNSSDSLLVVRLEEGVRCFVCGSPAIWCMLAEVSSPLSAKAMFAEAGSDIGPVDHYFQVSACIAHSDNLFKLCVLVDKNKDVITPSIIRQAMDGAWFFEMPITFVVRQRPGIDVIELCRLQNSIPILIAEVPFDSRQASQITDWLSTMLAVCLPGKSNDDFFPGLEEKLQAVLDQQVSTENPR